MALRRSRWWLIPALLVTLPLRADEPSLTNEEAAKLLQEMLELRQDVLDRDNAIDALRKHIERLQVKTNCA